MILDTTFLIDLMNEDDSAVVKLLELSQKNIGTAITVLSLFELYGGVFRRNANLNEKQKVLEVLTSQVIYVLDAKSAEIAGKIEAELSDKGQIISPPDILIAGICIKNNEPLLTRNVEHFSRIKGLKIEKY